MKLGRNDPCWCGSGVKFKKCHLHREAEAPLPQWELSANIRKAFSKKLCSAPAAMRGDCSEQIVRAHTVPRSGSLEKIAEKGHVYAFIPTLDNITRNDGLLPPQLVGINRASTFTGFCSVHDNRIFSSIERKEFLGSQEQCFLLAYRAYSREAFTKKASAMSARDHDKLDRGKPLPEQMFLQAVARAYDVGIQAGLRDIELYRPRFETPLDSGDYSAVRAYVISLAGPPPVMCSGAFAPEQDFDGSDLQDLADTTLAAQYISVTSFFGGRHGHVVFTWLEGDDPVCIPFMRSLAKVSDSDLASALIRLMFEFIENVHISPSWWEALQLDQRMALIVRMATSANPEMGRTPGCLKPDGWSVPTWEILERKWVGVP